jgi:hypothetical protein
MFSKSSFKSYRSNGGPTPDRPKGNPKDFSRLYNFNEFGHNPQTHDRSEFDFVRKFTKHYSEMTALQAR